MSRPVALTTVKLPAPALAGPGKAARNAATKRSPRMRCNIQRKRGLLKAIISGCVEDPVVGPRTMNDRRRSRTVAEALLQRQCRRAECAFSQNPSEIPMGAAAAGAV